MCENFSFWLVFVLSCQQVWRTTIYTPYPPTNDLLLLAPHTTVHLPPNHTLPPHNRTLPPFTQDIKHDPAVDMGGATHTRTVNTWKTDNHALGCHGGGGGKKDHTRSGDTGGEGEKTRICVNEGGEETSMSTYF